MFDLNPLIQRAVGAHQQGHLDQAANLYEQVLLQHPENVAALQLLGAIRGQQGRNTEAIRLTEAALRLQPEDFGTLANYASVLIAAGRYDDALALHPRFAPTYDNRGNAVRGLWLYSDAGSSGKSPSPYRSSAWRRNSCIASPARSHSKRTRPRLSSAAA